MAAFSYEYSPLEWTRDIRLVILAPASTSSDPIYCELKVASLDAKPSVQYEACSYCWGSPYGTLPITCDDRTLLVTLNLLEALRRIRKQDEPRTLWVDAICINQSDPVERSAQVQQMRDIYAKAGGVIVWLGEDYHLPSSDISFSKPLSLTSTRKLARMEIGCSWPGMMPNLKRNVQELASIRRQIPGIRWPAANPDLSKLCKSLMKAREAASLLLNQTLQALLGYDWFSRMWVLQESVVNNPMVMLAGDTIAWTDLADILLLVGRLRIHSLGTDSHELRRLHQMNGMRHEIVHNLYCLNSNKKVALAPSPSEVDKAFRVRTLTELLRVCQLFMCSDPRDKVYALLGLCRDDLSSQPKLLPDYNLAVTEVYRRFANHVIRETSSLEILAVGTTRSLPGLASWVPDWSANTDEGRWELKGSSESRKDRQLAHFIEIPFAPIRLVPTEDPQELGLMGYRLDVIKAVGLALTAQCHIGCTSFEENFARVAANWEELARSTLADGSDGFPATKFMETITSHPNLSKETDIAFREWLARHTAMRPSRSSLSSDGEVAGDASYPTNLAFTSSEEPGHQLITSTPASAATTTHFWSDLALDEVGTSESWDQGLWRRFDRYAWSAFKVANKPVDVLLQCTQWAKASCYGRSLYATRKGRIGLAPPRTRAGDVVVFFPGGTRPFAVRELGGFKGRFELVGDCTLSDVEWRELIRRYLNGELAMEGIVLR